MGTVVNALAAIGIAGSLTLGAMTTWNGGASLTAAKNKILAEADALNIYHTNEGKLLNKISGLKTDVSNLNAQITTLQSSGTADQTTITNLQQQVADDQKQIDTLNTELNQAGTNEQAMAQRIDDLEAQVQQANSDATALQSTVDSTTYTQSDQTAVDNAVADGTTTSTTDSGTSTSGSGTTTTTTVATDTRYVSSTGVQATEIDMITGTPYTMTSDGTLKLNTDTTGVYIQNTGLVTYTATVNGTNYTVPADNSKVYIGTPTALDQHNLTMSATNKATLHFWLLKK